MGSPPFMAKLVDSEYLSATVSADNDVHAAQWASATFRAVSMPGIISIQAPSLRVGSYLHDIIGSPQIVKLGELSSWNRLFYQGFCAA
jgi:hypothetical protein